MCDLRAANHGMTSRRKERRARRSIHRCAIIDSSTEDNSSLSSSDSQFECVPEVNKQRNDQRPFSSIVAPFQRLYRFAEFAAFVTPLAEVAPSTLFNTLLIYPPPCVPVRPQNAAGSLRICPSPSISFQSRWYTAGWCTSHSTRARKMRYTTN